METTVKNVITPNDQVVRDVFSRTKAYHIDIYQREYKWSNDQVEALLNDIEVRFGLHERKKTDAREISEDVLQNFDPYYLNTFLTNAEPTAVAVVDGQQRLTTLLIILIKLRKILVAIENHEDLKGKTFASSTLERLIFERDDFGSATRFKIFNENRETAFKAIVDDCPDFAPKDETQSRILENHKIISKYFDKFFSSKGDDRFDVVKLTYYICYLLDRISIVEIKIEQQKSVAMIFEVVNDRGLGLKPHEILKGKFIGGLSKEKKELANKTWCAVQNDFFERNLQMDDFLQTYFRSKFACDGKTGYDKFSDKHYHYELYKNQASLTFFQNFQNSDFLYKFIDSEFKYYADLYKELTTSYAYEEVFFNRLNQQNQQYLLILSSIEVKDKNKDEKVKLVSRKFDQLYTITSLLGAFDSRDIQLNIFQLNEKIRDKSLEEISSAFDEVLLGILKDKEKIQDIPADRVAGIFRYELFKSVSNASHGFSKYVLTRIDRYIAEKLDLPSYVRCSLEELESRYRTKRKYGLHLEHILAHNMENHAQFVDEETEELDESKFNMTRNLFGLVLLLKDRQNESSNNENVTKKLNRYKTSDFVWNRLLVGHLDKVDMRDVPKSWGIEVIEATEEYTFPLDKINKRQKAFFELVKEIWNF
ncbi:MAG: DUF262 domain-containing protein [Desulfobacterales bacterium]|nr:DUF262 domain-containing protein [Desulfobacterales bacterium]